MSVYSEWYEEQEHNVSKMLGPFLILMQVVEIVSTTALNDNKRNFRIFVAEELHSSECGLEMVL